MRMNYYRNLILGKARADLQSVRYTLNARTASQRKLRDILNLLELPLNENKIGKLAMITIAKFADLNDSFLLLF